MSASFTPPLNSSHIDLNTGEFTPLETNDKGQISAKFDRFEFRSLKYALQSTAREILPKTFTHESTGKEAKHRVKWCLRSVLSHNNSDKNVSVFKDKATGHTHYGNLMVCGSVWTCPVCASKITEKRAKNIQSMIDQHVESGGMVLMTTFTMPHGIDDSLKTLLSSFQGSGRVRGALEACLNTKKVKELKKLIAFKGTINSLEITYGQRNGWHPHSHQLWFVSKGTCPKAVKDWLYPYWVRACEKKGLGTPSYERGIDIRVANTAGEYVAKMGWSASKEIAKGHTKKGKQGNYAPFDLLAEYLESESQWAANAFSEYAKGTYRRQYIRVSPTLKKLYDWDNREDEVLASENTEDATLLGFISFEQWRKVLKAPNGRVVILELASKNWEAVLLYIESLPALNFNVNLRNNTS